MAPLNILINGAGVAGTCLALILTRQGHAVTVLERAPELRTSGLQVDLRGPGIQVLRKLGLEPGFLACAAKEEGLQLVDHRGRRWAYFPAIKRTAGRGQHEDKKVLQSFTSEYEIMRGDLSQLMYNAVNANADIKWRFGSEVVGLTEPSTSPKGRKSVTATILDNRTKKVTEESYDLVVGADGVGSKVRRLMTAGLTRNNTAMMTLDNDNAFLPFDGDYNGYFTIPRAKLDGSHKSASVATTFMAPGQAIMTRGNTDADREQVYLMCSSRNEVHNPLLKAHQERNVLAQKNALAEIFASCKYKRMPELLQGLMDTDDFYLERLGIVRRDTWCSVVASDKPAQNTARGRVVLLGDAGYCPSVKTGMGTTCAMIGAWTLGNEIGLATRNNDNRGDINQGLDEKLDAALAAYEEKLRPCIDQVQRGLPEQRTSFDMFMETRFGVALMYGIMALASFLRIDVLSKFLLREEIKDWDLPAYAD